MLDVRVMVKNAVIASGGSVVGWGTESEPAKD
jgi:hypothetical protein